MLKKKSIKSLKSISFTHGPLNSKKVKDLPEIFSPICHLEIKQNPNWKIEKEVKETGKDITLWKEFKSLYSHQQERIKLGEKKKVNSEIVEEMTVRLILIIFRRLKNKFKKQKLKKFKKMKI